MQQFSCEKQKQQLGVHFLLFKHLLLFGYLKKNHFFLSTALKPTRDKRSITDQVLLNSPKKILWSMMAHSTVLPLRIHHKY